MSFIEDQRWIHGHCAVKDDDLHHISSDDSNTMTLCGKPVHLVSRGLSNATCLKCRETWHGLNPVEVDKES